MSTSFVRSLFLVCGLILTLPSGWCCLLPAQGVDTTIQSKAASCCTGHTEQPACPAEPAPPIKDCCCSSTFTTLTPNVEPATPDLTAAISFLVLDADRPSVFAGVEIDAISHFTTRSLQLLHCVWRC